MLNIAVCDDDLTILDSLESYLTRFEEESKGTHFQITCFRKSEELLKNIQNGRTHHIYILDMIMPNVDGIELGRAIRKRDDKAILIYLTSSKDFAYDAWSVQAQRYLLKPVKESELREAMHFAVGQVNRQPVSFSINTTAGIQQIDRDCIEYVENMSRTLHVHMVDGKEIVSRFLRRSFEESMEELLNCGEFVQVHKSYIVNLQYIKIYRQAMVTVRSGKELPVSKNKQAGVKKAYLKYMSDNLI